MTEIVNYCLNREKKISVCVFVYVFWIICVCKNVEHSEGSSWINEYGQQQQKKTTNF